MPIEQPALEQLFEAARTVERAPHAEQARLRGTVAARLSAAGIALSSTALSGEAAAAAGNLLSHVTLLSTVKAKVLLGLMVASTATTGIVLVQRSMPSHAAAVAQTKTETVSPRMAHVPMFPQRHVTVSAPTLLQEASGNREPTRSAQPPSKAETDGLAEELKLVRGAQGELAARRPSRGLALLDRYFQRFPAGILQPEARATRVHALCLAGRTVEAERAAAHFAEANPDSPLATHIQTCKAP
jgi:hypothetical protein